MTYFDNIILPENCLNNKKLITPKTDGDQKRVQHSTDLIIIDNKYHYSHVGVTLILLLKNQ